jgi:hypothetical protein
MIQEHCTYATPLQLHYVHACTWTQMTVSSDPAIGMQVFAMFHMKTLTAALLAVILAALAPSTEARPSGVRVPCDMTNCACDMTNCACLLSASAAAGLTLPVADVPPAAGNMIVRKLNFAQTCCCKRNSHGVQTLQCEQ